MSLDPRSVRRQVLRRVRYAATGHLAALAALDEHYSLRFVELARGRSGRIPPGA